MVLDDAAVARLGGAAALVIGTVAEDGRPHGCRAWAAEPDVEAGVLRVAVDAGDERLMANLRAGGRVALTSANVVTLASLQVKGRVIRIEAPTALDVAVREQRTELFLADVAETDRVSRDLLDALVPADFLVCRIAVEELFDQTPGPAAGREIADGVT